MIVATKRASPAVRVAVYTRKSVAEGLDMEFNTLDAQREAVEAYVQSQRGEGWGALPERYDDGGYTGANTERPAFRRLLADVEAGKVDVVAVYKIDRLSRSLVDFTQLLETFKRRGVAFVSVTQSFDTSTPMGRMVVSLLATFAEFERETIAERVRDKVHAARRRGMWTGGRVPLGYDVVEKRLVVDPSEAERVREILGLYLEIGGLLPTANELNARGWLSKGWTTKDGRVIPGRLWNGTSLYSLLTNPLVIGKVRAGRDVVDGQHEAVVDQETWDRVQAQLARKAPRPRGWRAPKRDGALLAGLLTCTCGASMIRSSTRKGGRRYFSYVCRRVLKHGAAACPGSRAPTGSLERFVLDQIKVVGRDPRVLDATVAADREAREARRPEMEAEVRRLGQERSRLEAERGNVGRGDRRGRDQPGRAPAGAGRGARGGRAAPQRGPARPHGPRRRRARPGRAAPSPGRVRSPLGRARDARARARPRAAPRAGHLRRRVGRGRDPVPTGRTAPADHLSTRGRGARQRAGQPLTSRTTPMTKTYTRRTPEEVVADLEAQIAAVKQRAAQKEAAAEVKGSPDGIAFLAAVKAADRAIRLAGESGNDAMVRALEAVRAPLAEHLVSMGIRLPDRKAGRRRKTAAAAR